MKYSDIVNEWQKTQISSREDLYCKLNNFRILFAYNSNVIENPETTFHNTQNI